MSKIIIDPENDPELMNLLCSELSEHPPSIAEDSELPEWTVGECEEALRALFFVMRNRKTRIWAALEEAGEV